MSASSPTSIIGSFFRQAPSEGNLAPVPFTAVHERLRQIAALWADGRCLIAKGYEEDRELVVEIERLQQRHKILEVLSRRSGTLEDVASAWSDERRVVSHPAGGTMLVLGLPADAGTPLTALPQPSQKLTMREHSCGTET